MNSKIENIRIHCFDYPRDRVIGDSQISSSRVWIGALEIFDEDGLSGLGFFQSLTSPLPNAHNIRELLNANGLDAMLKQPPEGLIHKVYRPRGGNIQALPYHLDQALDQALWDLVAKRANLPLFKLLGGTEDRVKAYGSGVCFHLTEDEVTDFYSKAIKHNFSGYKVKVGHADLSRDIKRLKQIVEIVGPDKLIMVDSNEAWSPKEAISKIKAFEQAGVPIYWVEDPILRTDYAGLREIKHALGNTYLNAGEYLNLAGKKALVENDAADVINIHGDFSSALKIGWLCAEKGIPIALGNTPMEMGAHIASALPEVLYTEHSMLNWDYIVKTPYKITDGFIELPNINGHGLILSTDAIGELKPSIS
ncbi:mandelate racemase/muconate lactonizing enzyme family protein [Aliiglaciecola sp. 3_MG-2023]|uniref:mandelate racemase/muconate lactonizing enzyme family protein n=1 Tax=Aliiglaciecola sp. 3_MG-2023 TaxID=3062644 RepID=UPI0026E41F78|nr:mandelate racemase/muconate lactonizing enzyme family protein [Aliiglaciecola sp. 3_MG-2023]MDO6695318.1 mandelate racemase/muconate lactonizing enzyme family protein [Aliiglaciecola sp. 3_MG-2023]